MLDVFILMIWAGGVWASWSRVSWIASLTWPLDFGAYLAKTTLSETED